MLEFFIGNVDVLVYENDGFILRILMVSMNNGGEYWVGDECILFV